MAEIAQSLDNHETPETQHDPILRTVWERFLQYDSAAVNLKSSHIRLRTLVLVLGFLASLLAVALGTSVFRETKTIEHVYPFIIVVIPVLLFVLPQWSYIRLQNSSLPSSQKAIATILFIGLCIILVVLEIAMLGVALEALLRFGSAAILEALTIILFLLPLISAGVMTYSTRFSPSQLWIQYRYIAELIRRELYLYRLMAGKYERLDENARKLLLLTHVTQIENNEVEDEDEAEEKPTSSSLTSTIPVTVFEPLRAYAGDIDQLKQKIKMVKFDKDDGFEQLTVANYLKYRVQPMLFWYTQRCHGEYQDMRRWQIAGIFIGVVGAFLVFLGHEAWIAVTTSAGITISALANLKLYGRTYFLYHKAAADLSNRLTAWEVTKSSEALTTQEQEAQLILDFEDIFQKEVELWRQQAQESVAQSDTSIYEGLQHGAGSEYIPSDWLVQQSAPASLPSS